MATLTLMELVMPVENEERRGWGETDGSALPGHGDVSWLTLGLFLQGLPPLVQDDCVPRACLFSGHLLAQRSSGTASLRKHYVDAAPGHQCGRVSKCILGATTAFH